MKKASTAQRGNKQSRPTRRRANMKNPKYKIDDKVQEKQMQGKNTTTYPKYKVYENNEKEIIHNKRENTKNLQS